jgi:acyl-CoA synthetase (AMP-forming)/AMP-acid ligase II
MPDLLSALAAVDPTKVAFIEGDRAVTYAEHQERARRAANALRAMGVGQGDRVAVQSHNSILAFEASAGLQKLGGVTVPVNFRLRGAELAYIINDSGARAVCAGPEFVPHIDAVRPEVRGEVAYIALAGPPPPGWHAYEELLASASADDLPPPPSWAGSMIYTSGTTGHPKGAYRPRGLPAEAASQTILTFGLRPDDVHLQAGPGYHSAVAFFCALTMAVTGTVVVMPRFDPEAALRLIQRHRVTTTFMAPTLLHRIMDLPEAVRARYDVSSMRALILGAAPCPFSLKQRAQAYFGECLWEFYGATETGVNLVLRPEEQLRHPGSAGRPLEGQEILLLDDDGNPVPDGQPGELWVRNIWLASYYGRPDATARSMRDGFFSVGDVAYRDREGYYYICDRKIDMIISGGVNIYPAEIEACLHAHPAVQDVAVIGVPDDHWGESVKAFVVPKPGAAPAPEELIDWCRDRLADYKRPRSVDLVERLPRDEAGKLLKRRIREPYWEGTGRRI